MHRRRVPEECARAPHCTVRANQQMCHVTRLFKPDWPALYSAGPARIPQEHGAYVRLSRPFLDFFVGGSGYETKRRFGGRAH